MNTNNWHARICQQLNVSSLDSVVENAGIFFDGFFSIKLGVKGDENALT